MPTRLAYSLLTLTLCAVAAVIGVAIAARGDGNTGVDTGPTGWAGFVRPPGAMAHTGHGRIKLRCCSKLRKNWPSSHSVSPRCTWR